MFKSNLDYFKSFFSYYPEYTQFSQSQNDLYDIIIQINSLLDLTKGWKVSYPILDLYKQKYEQVLSDKTQVNLTKDTDELKVPKRKAVVSILGLYNRGKSYIISRIFGLDFSNSCFAQSEGLSIVTSRTNITEILIGIDTKASQKPIAKGKKSYIKDAEATERFILNLTLNLSDVVIIVVNRLTRDDKSYIKQVKRTFKNKRNIIVVHNLTHVNSIQQVDDIIKEEIERCFDCKRSQVGDFSPYWTSPDGTRHVVMAKDENIIDSGTSKLKYSQNAGYMYNARTIKLLQVWLRTSAVISTERCDIVEGIVKFSKQVITNYLEIDINSLKCVEKSGIAEDSSLSTSTSTPPLTSNVPKQLETTPLQNIVLESADTGEILIKFNPPLPESTVLKYADIQFNIIGTVYDHFNIPSRVEEDDQFYYLTLDCPGFIFRDLIITFQNVYRASEISIQSYSPRVISLRGINIIHNNFNKRPLKWSFIFPTKVKQTSAQDLTKENCSMENGNLKIKLTKSNEPDGCFLDNMY